MKNLKYYQEFTEHTIVNEIQPTKEVIRKEYQ